MCSQGNEILTLAFGHYSCHLATNFFNIQEASFSYNPNFSTGINHDISFSENSRRSHLYSPRLILVDDEDSLGYLSREGYYKESSESIMNEADSNEIVIFNEPKWAKNDFVFDFEKEKQRLQSESGPCQDFLLKASYNLDESVASWSDYVITEFDGHTITTLPKYTEYYENYDNFNCYDSGQSVWKETALCDSVEEKVRFFLEGSENLQGFQLLTDGDKGYSGISAGCAELLRDEYSKKAIITVPSIYLQLDDDEDVRVRYKKRCDRVYSLASCFSSFAEYCDIVAPMSHVYNPWGKEPRMRQFRNIKYKENMMYHTSAILAGALDLFTLPYRLQNVPTTMNNMSSVLNICGRCFTAVGVNMPFPYKESSFPTLEDMGGRFFESLTPMIDVNPDYIDIQAVTSKGLGRIFSGKPSKLEDPNHHIIESDFKLYLQQLFPKVVTQLSSCKSVFRMPRTFPKVLDNHFNLTRVEHDFGPLSEFITIGGLHNSKEMLDVLSNLHQEAKVIRKKAVTGFRPRDSDLDYEGFFENLKMTTDAYSDSSYI